MGKLVPGQFRFLSSLSGCEEGHHLPLLPKFPSGEAGRVYENLLVEAASSTGPSVATAPFQPLHSRNQCFRARGRRGEGGVAGQGRGAGKGGQWPFSAVPGKQGLSPKHLHRLSGSSGHLPSPVGPKPHGVPQSGEGSGEEDHKDDEEDDEDEENFDHEPPVGGN